MSVSLHAITFDCADPDRLAAFWAAFLGREPDASQSPGFATIGYGADKPFFVFQQLDGLSVGLNRVHVDFATGGDLDGETERLLGLGATIVQRVEENGIRFVTFADPEGNKFDVTDE